MPRRSSSQQGDVNVNQSGMDINGHQIIGQNIYFGYLEQHASSGLYAFYKLQDIVEKMTAGTGRLSKDIDGCTNDIMQLMKLRDQYSRELLREQRTSVLNRAADILHTYSQELETMSKQYAPNLAEIDRSIGSFIMAHQSEALFYRDEILLLAARLSDVERHSNHISSVLSQMFSTMQTISDSGAATEKLVNAVRFGKSRVNVLIELFNETSVVVARLVRLVNMLTTASQR